MNKQAENGKWDSPYELSVDLTKTELIDFWIYTQTN